MGEARPRRLKGQAPDELELTAVLQALSDPVRLRIVRTLAADGRERACGSFGVPVAKSTLTHHMKVLRETGIITQRLVGTSRLTCLQREALEGRFPGLLDAVLGDPSRLSAVRPAQRPDA